MGFASAKWLFLKSPKLRARTGHRGGGVPALHSTRPPGHGQSWGWPRASRPPPGDFLRVTYWGEFLFNAARRNGGRHRRSGQGKPHQCPLLGSSALIGIFSGPTRESPPAVSGVYSSSQCTAAGGHAITSLAWDSAGNLEYSLKQGWTPLWDSGLPQAPLEGVFPLRANLRERACPCVRNDTRASWQGWDLLALTCCFPDDAEAH